jgi:hypothetical protein
VVAYQGRAVKILDRPAPSRLEALNTTSPDHDVASQHGKGPIGVLPWKRLSLKTTAFAGRTII